MLKKLDKYIKSFSKSEKEKTIFLLSFLLPFVMLIIIMIAKQVYPFGNKCILRTDFYHQYLPFYSELKYKLTHFRSFLYTYDVGLGTNFVTLYAYYLSCPFNILLFLVPQNFVLEFMTLMIVIKISLAGLTMSYYLVRRYKSDNYVIVVFAVLYAMSGYIGAYYWNIMWLDNIVLFPLLMLGTENVYNGKKPYLYIIILALSILCNYYIGVITCIFLIVYFVFYNILKNYDLKRFFKNFLLIAIYSIIAVLISAVLLLPVIMAFGTTASSGGTFPTEAREYFSFAKALGRHLVLSKSENGIEYWPNIYSGVICLPLLVLYFSSKKFKLKEKICYAILLLFFLASFSINILDYVWHVLKYPNSLPCRQSFIYTFILLTICIKPLLKYKNLKVKDLAYSFVGVIAGIVLLESALLSDKVEFYSIYVSIIFLLIYFVILIRLSSKKSRKVVVTGLLLIFISVETFVNMYQTSIYTITRGDYMQNVSDIRTIVKNLKTKTNDFYRIERVDMKAKDDGAFINFPSSSIFSSSSYKSGSDFYKQYGMEASTNAYSITGSTPFMDSILSVKYKVFENEFTDAADLNLRAIDKVGDVSMYQNIDTMPLSYMLDREFLANYDTTSGNPATIQNNFARTLGLDVMLVKNDIAINGIKAFFNVKESGDYYAFIRDKSIKEVTVSYATTSKQFKNMNRGYFIELGYLKAGSDIEFRNDTNEKDILMEVFRFDYDAFKNVINELKSYSDFHINDYTDSHISYSIDVKKDGKCVISLPYDEGFRVKVDGKEVKTEPVLNFLIGFDLDRGLHEIDLTYIPKGLRLGALLSILGIALLIAIYVYDRKRSKAKYIDNSLNK
ncbi:MAG: YfhO family protein [Lachnospiraceae bacterium]|nr:YfhO family protein [Lachnospiraceae bacterium]